MKPQQYSDMFLSMAYPATQGWVCTGKRIIGSHVIDHMLYHEDGQHVAVKRLSGTLVSPKDLRMARKLLKDFQRSMPGTEVRVLLVYGALLMPPTEFPKGISFASVYCGIEPSEQLTDQSHVHLN